MYNVLEMTLFWEERVILMLDIQTLNRIDLSFEVIALISGVWRNSLLVPCGCFQVLPLPPTPCFSFHPGSLFPFSLIHRGKHLPEGLLMIVPKYWFMFECMHADSSCLGTHSRHWKGRGTSCPARHQRWHAKNCSSLQLRNPGSFLVYKWFTYTSCFSDFPPTFPCYFGSLNYPKR